MKYVCMDTSHRHLVIALIEDQTVVAGCAIPSWKNSLKPFSQNGSS